MRAEQLVLSVAGKDAVKRFRDAKPWGESFAVRLEKFKGFAAEFAEACGMTVKFEFLGDESPGRPGNGGYDPVGNRVVLVGKLSVVTTLFAFGMVGGLERGEALKWATKLFRHYFPRSFARCRMVNGILVNGGTA